MGAERLARESSSYYTWSQLTTASPCGTTRLTSRFAKCPSTSRLSGKTLRTACVTSSSRRFAPSVPWFVSMPCPNLRPRTTSSRPPLPRRRATGPGWAQRSPRRPTLRRTRMSTPTRRSSVSSARSVLLRCDWRNLRISRRWVGTGHAGKESALDYTSDGCRLYELGTVALKRSQTI